jgi:hypothetical protein
LEYVLLLFKGLSKVLICGGYNSDTCEVIDLQSSATTCKNPPNFPATVYWAIGGLGFKEKPIICGGWPFETLSNRCYSLENNEWILLVSMNVARYGAGEAMLRDGKLFVTGGANLFGNSVNSVEILTEEGWEKNLPSLSLRVLSHCIVTVNSTTVMAIGGLQNAFLAKLAIQIDG